MDSIVADDVMCYTCILCCLARLRCLRLLCRFRTLCHYYLNKKTQADLSSGQEPTIPAKLFNPQPQWKTLSLTISSWSTGCGITLLLRVRKKS